MPRIKRWFPVSQDINSDPEIWQLTDKFGVTGLRAWLEILSISDRNDGELPGLWTDYPRLLAGRCQSTTRHLLVVCQFIGRWLLVDSQGTARVLNYSKYHKTREPNKFPSEPSEPSYTYKNKYKKPPISPKGGRRIIDDLVFNKFWQSYPKKVGKDAAYKAWCKEAKHCLDVQSAIFEALTWQVGQDQWQRDGGQYIPNPATYLNQGRWKDKPVEVSDGRKQPEPKGFEALRQFQAIRERQIR